MVLSGLPLTERNLILTGYSEPNKPRIARQVASQLRMRYVDVGDIIEARYGDTVEQLRDRFGERHIKSIESEAMDDVLLHRSSVVRVEPSALLHSDHLPDIQQTGVVICLVARLDALLQRLHLTLGARFHDPAVRGAALGSLRREAAIRQHEGIYEIDVTYMGEADIVNAVIDLWQRVAIIRA